MKIHRLAITFLVIATLTGCSQDDKSSKRVQPEILLATECGFDKLACCSSVPTCNFGQQCCVDPNNYNRNYCSEDCSCGGEEEFCCENSKCSNGLVCRDGLCLKCGGEADVCCPGVAACSSSLACLNDKCVKCGENGNPCCQGSESCKTGKGENNECFAGLCRSCGFDGSPACSSTAPCLKNQLLTGDRCERCGELNKPCCDQSLGLGNACGLNKKLVCELGFCSEIK